MVADRTRSDSELGFVTRLAASSGESWIKRQIVGIRKSLRRAPVFMQTESSIGPIPVHRNGCGYEEARDSKRSRRDNCAGSLARKRLKIKATHLSNGPI